MLSVPLHNALKSLIFEIATRYDVLPRDCTENMRRGRTPAEMHIVDQVISRPFSVYAGLTWLELLFLLFLFLYMTDSTCSFEPLSLFRPLFCPTATRSFPNMFISSFLPSAVPLADTTGEIFAGVSPEEDAKSHGLPAARCRNCSLNAS